MNYRRYLLPSILAAVALLYFGDMLVNRALKGPLERRRQRTAAAERAIERAKQERNAVFAALDQLTALEARSLPTDSEAAGLFYKQWLLELIDHSGFTYRNVVGSEPVSRRGLYRSMSFSVVARGTLGQLTKFLMEFYHAGHLHKIESLVITPEAKTEYLQLTILIEALILPKASYGDAEGTLRTDALTTAVSDCLVFDSLADYRAIERRNLFGTGGAADAAEHTRLTSIVSADDQPVAWFSLGIEGRVEKLQKDDRLQVDWFSGRVTEIAGTDVVLTEDNGDRWLLTTGDSLAEAAALPPEF